MKHEKFLREAIRLSVENVKNGRGGPFGAVVVRDDTIIAEGANEVTQSCDPTAHAEIVALRRACAEVQDFELRGCILYSSCEPCPMCLAAAYWARVDAVYFAATQEDAAGAGFDDAFLYRELTIPRGARALLTVSAEPLRPVAREAFLLWQESPIRTPY